MINSKTDLDSVVLGDLIRDGNGMRQGIRMMVIRGYHYTVAIHVYSGMPLFQIP